MLYFCLRAFVLMPTSRLVENFALESRFNFFLLDRNLITCQRKYLSQSNPLYSLTAICGVFMNKWSDKHWVDPGLIMPDADHRVSPVGTPEVGKGGPYEAWPT